jgi:uncharacterized membrane protein
MIIWILVLPSSALQDYHGPFASSLEKMRSITTTENEYNFLPLNLITKYKGHIAVHLTHTLPAAIWAAIIPFQIHPGIRRSNRYLHRILGYIFLVVCISIAIGVLIILRRGLLFENFMNNREGTNSSKKQTPALLLMITFWYLWTVKEAIKEAKRKNFDRHQKWIIRHIASGLWVAIQRLLIVIVMPVLNSNQFFIVNAQLVQRHLFGKAAMIGMTITVLVSEFAIIKIDELKRIQRKHT